MDKWRLINEPTFAAVRPATPAATVAVRGNAVSELVAGVLGSRVEYLSIQPLPLGYDGGMKLLSDHFRLAVTALWVAIGLRFMQRGDAALAILFFSFALLSAAIAIRGRLKLRKKAQD
jgi:hypothetical protein